jgi:hypothetical protein
VMTFFTPTAIRVERSLSPDKANQLRWPGPSDSA